MSSMNGDEDCLAYIGAAWRHVLWFACSHVRRFELDEAQNATSGLSAGRAGVDRRRDHAASRPTPLEADRP